MLRQFLPAEWEQRKLIHVVLALRDKFPVVLQVLGGIAALVLGVVSSSPGKWTGWKLFWILVLIGIAILMLVVVPFVDGLRRKSRLKLEAAHAKALTHVKAQRDALQQRHHTDTAELRHTIEGVARVLMRDCNLSSTKSRISVYQHEADHAVFIQVGRVSDNPQWERAGRSYYPDDHGHIAQGWREETVYQTHRRAQPEPWAQAQVKLGMSYEVALAIEMKSRSYLGIRLEHEAKKVGMVMAESVDPNGVDVDLADTMREHESFAQLAAMLAVAPKLPIVKEYVQ